MFRRVADEKEYENLLAVWRACTRQTARVWSRPERGTWDRMRNVGSGDGKHSGGKRKKKGAAAAAAAAKRAKKGGGEQEADAEGADAVLGDRSKTTAKPKAKARGAGAKRGGKAGAASKPKGGAARKPPAKPKK